MPRSTGVALSAFRPLRHPGFARLWAAGLVSNIGTWMESVAVGVLITELTGQAAWTGLVAALAFVPLAVIGPVGGALADRLERRRYLVVVLAAQSGLAASLALLAALGLAAPLPVAGIMLMTGIMTALRLPAWQSLLPDVVPQEDLPGAISLASAQFNLGRVVGPALAGVVIATGGYALAFAANAASFGAAILAVVLVRLPPRETKPSPFFRHLVDGFVQARRDPGISTSVSLMATAGFLGAPFIALVPAVAVFVYGGGPQETAILVTAQGIGAVGAALAVSPLVDRFGRARVLLGALLILPLALIGYALAPSFAVAVVWMLVVGGAYLAVLSGLNTVVQIRAGPALRGRALSFFMVALGGSYPIGAVAQGAVADHVGLRLVTAVTAVLLLMLVLTVRWRRPDLMRSLGEDRPE